MPTPSDEALKVLSALAWERAGTRPSWNTLKARLEASGINTGFLTPAEWLKEYEVVLGPSDESLQAQPPKSNESYARSTLRGEEAGPKSDPRNNMNYRQSKPGGAEPGLHDPKERLSRTVKNGLVVEADDAVIKPARSQQFGVKAALSPLHDARKGVNPLPVMRPDSQLAMEQILEDDYSDVEDLPSRRKPKTTPLGRFRCEHPSCWDMNDKFRFQVFADLARHYKYAHPDPIQNELFPCDYHTCRRAGPEDAFTRKDAYRDHLREYHMEDMAKRHRNANWQQSWLASRIVSSTWWRCVRCLDRINVASDGWACPNCKQACEPERMEWRKKSVWRSNEHVSENEKKPASIPSQHSIISFEDFRQSKSVSFQTPSKSDETDQALSAKRTLQTHNLEKSIDEGRQANSSSPGPGQPSPQRPSSPTSAMGDANVVSSDQHHIHSSFSFHSLANASPNGRDISQLPTLSFSNGNLKELNGWSWPASPEKRLSNDLKDLSTHPPKEHEQGRLDTSDEISYPNLNGLEGIKDEILPPSTPVEHVIQHNPPIEFEHIEYNSHERVPFTTIKHLGRGSLGSVDAVHRQGEEGGSILARKVVAISKVARKRLLPLIQQEVAVLRTLSHKHIVQVVSTYETTSYPRQFCIIISPAGDEDLSHFLERVGENEFPEEDLKRLRRWQYCLASAVAYIHSHNIRHKDIKPSNAICKGDEIYLTDFGSAHQFNSGLTSSTEGYAVGVTKMYSAPEVVHEDRRGRPADIYSLGCVFSEMVTVINKRGIEEFHDFRSEPVPDEPDRMTLCYYATAHKMEDWFATLDDSTGFALISKMMAQEQKLRPTAEEVLGLLAGQHTFIDCTCGTSIRHGERRPSLAEGKDSSDKPRSEERRRLP